MGTGEVGPHLYAREPLAVRRLRPATVQQHAGGAVIALEIGPHERALEAVEFPGVMLAVGGILAEEAIAEIRPQARVTEVEFETLGAVVGGEGVNGDERRGGRLDHDLAHGQAFPQNHKMKIVRGRGAGLEDADAGWDVCRIVWGTAFDREKTLLEARPVRPGGIGLGVA